ncbi:uncharacterized protein LOC124421421 isoform X3 [Lucilia cuprina]|uniref:uncharacterized protein LOC124421421 isoform X3 n=1 Tax=Lucilia cuprina TaxID=7375 RepID=UPI001F066E07|nr:uncharacterized protein LOC124421421 isoform X3 [Lucilia cuprina]
MVEGAPKGFSKGCNISKHIVWNTGNLSVIRSSIFNGWIMHSREKAKAQSVNSKKQLFIHDNFKLVSSVTEYLVK